MYTVGLMETDLKRTRKYIRCASAENKSESQKQTSVLPILHGAGGEGCPPEEDEGIQLLEFDIIMHLNHTT